MKLPRVWRWAIAAVCFALVALLMWSERGERAAQREAPVAARTPAQGPDSRPDTAGRERPTRERTQRP